MDPAVLQPSGSSETPSATVILEWPVAGTSPSLQLGLDSEGGFVHANPAFLELLGESGGRLKQAGAWRSLSCGLAVAIRTAVGRVQEEGLARRHRLHHQDRWYELCVTPTLNAAGEVIGAAMAGWDITESLKAEDRVSKGEQRDPLIEGMPNGFAYCRVHCVEGEVEDFTHLKVNAAFEKLTGLQGVIGKRLTELLPGIRDRDPELIRRYGRVAMTGVAEQFEIYVKSVDRWYSVSAYSPQREFFVAVFDNVTERKRVEAELAKARIRYETLLETASDGIHVLDSSGRLIEASRSFYGMLGYPAKDPRLSHVSDWDAQWSAEELKVRLEEFIHAPAVFRTRHRCLDGRVMEVEVNARGIEVDGKTCLYASSRDVTARVAAEQARDRAEERIRGLTALQQTMLDTIPLGVGCLRDRKFVWANPAHDRIFGYASDELMGMSTRVLYHSEADFQRMGCEGYAALRAGTTYTAEVQLKRKDGSVLWCSLSGRALDPENLELGSIWTVSDTTVARQMREQLRLSEHRHRTILSSMAEGVVFQSADGVIVDCNHRAEVILGLTRDQILGRLFLDPGWRALKEDGSPFHGDDHPAMVTLRTGKACHNVTMQIGLPDGSTRWININSEPLFEDESAMPHAVVSSFADITGRRQVEMAREELLRRLQKLASRVPGVLYQYQLFPDGRSCFPFASEAMQGIYCVSPEEVRDDASKVFRFLHPDDLEGVVASIQESARELTPWSHEYRVRQEDGTVRWLLGNSVPQREADGSILWHGFITDITRRKEDEGRVRTLSAQLAGMIEGTRDIVAMINSDFRYILFNASFREEVLRIFGHEVKAGDSMLEVLAALPGDLADARVHWSRALAGEDFTITQQFGSIALERNWYELHFSPVRGCEGTVIGAMHIIRNVTKRKLAEEALLASQAFLDDIIEHSPNPMWISDREGTLLRMNQACRDMLHLHDHEVVGKYNLLRDAQVEAQGFMPQVRNVFERAEHARFVISYDTGEWSDIRPSRTAKAVLDVSLSPIRDAQGTVINVVVQHSDITEHRRMEERLRQSQKMEGIGHLAGGMAHEFNNILAIMLLTLDTLERGALTAESKVSITSMIDLCNRAASLIKQLLAFSRQSVMRLERVDLNSLVATQCSLLKPLLGDRVQLEFAGNPRVPAVRGDVAMLQQIVMNLCLNARDAMNGRGLIRIRLEARELRDEIVMGTDTVPPGSYVRLAVADAGCGMSRAVLDRLFEPFFSTKGVGKGTGLGLATVRGMVTQHRGWVEVESTEGVGSTFRVNIPADTANATNGEVGEPTPSKGPTAPGQGTILLVEDDPSLRFLIAEILRREGYTVLVAGDGDAAFKVWRTGSTRIDLLLADVMMPGGLSGIELAGRMLQDQPDLKVVVSSAYSPTLDGLGESPGFACGYLAKPFQPDRLLVVVRECLEPGRVP